MAAKSTRDPWSLWLCAVLVVSSVYAGLATSLAQDGAASGPGPGMWEMTRRDGSAFPADAADPYSLSVERVGLPGPVSSGGAAQEKETSPRPRPGPAGTVAGFEGLHYGNNEGISNTIAPPDVQVAVGPAHVMELVNWIGAIWTKDGARVSTFRLQTLFNTPASDGLGDPKILYDDLSGRWFASAMDVDLPGVLLAVSSSSDPTAPWRTANFTTPGANCPDQPHLGLTEDKVVITVNAFTDCRGALVGGQYWVINKADLLTGTIPRYAEFGPTNYLTSIHPAHSLSSGTTQYMFRTVPPTTIQMFEVTGVPPGSVSVATTNLAVAPMGAVPDGVQPGTTYVLDAADSRVQDALWDRGALWLGLGDGCTPPGDAAVRACLRLIEVVTSDRTVRQDFDVGSRGNDSLYPTLRTDIFGGLVVGFSLTSATTYPSAAIAVRTSADPPNTLQPPAIVRPGTGVEQPPYGSCPLPPVCRFGDYSGSGRDPADTTTVWSGMEYSTEGGWGTYIAATRISPPLTGSLTASYSVVGGGTGFAPPRLTYVDGGVTRTLDLTSVPTTVSADLGSPWNVTNPLVESGARERWLTDEPTEGIAGSQDVIEISYRHQVSVSFDFTVSGGGSGYSPPSVTYAYFATSRRTGIRVDVWADANASYAFDGLLPGSGPWEAWRVSGGTGQIPAPETFAAAYFHQYLVGFGYAVVGSDPLGNVPPSVSCTVFGASATVPADGPKWVDSDSPYAYPQQFMAPSGLERWIGVEDVSGTITAPANVTARYYHQVYLTISVNIKKGGSTLPPSGWYNGSASVAISATPARNWRFMGWQGTGRGSYTGPNPTATIVMNGPITENASFHAGLKVRSSAGGSIAWRYEGAAGVVAPEAEEDLYVPPGVELTLMAEPSLFHTFTGWRGDVGDDRVALRVVITQPANVTATFGLDWVPVAGTVLGLGAVAAVVVAAVAKRRSRRRRGRGRPR